jgi:esterase/lipase superfamily enzyme
MSGGVTRVNCDILLARMGGVMVEYMFGAIVGAILASVVFLVARLLGQQQRQFDTLQASVTHQLDTIRQEAIQDRQRDDAVAAGLRSLQQGLDQEIASGRTAADSMKELGKKLDTLSNQTANKIIEGGVVTGVGFPKINILKGRPTWTSDFKGGFKGFVNPDEERTHIAHQEELPGSVTDFGLGDHTFGHDYQELFPDYGGIHGLGQSSPMNDPFTTRTSAPAPQPAEKAPPSSPPPPVDIDTRSADPAREDHRIVDLMFATNRKFDDAQERFTGERNPEITFGAAFVRVPERHSPGGLERPWNFTLFSYTLYRQEEDPKKHFVLRDPKILTKERWLEVIGSASSEDVLVFVHGFNNSFEDALYRNAQIVWDLGFKGTAVLFSWPSRGAIADYAYDRESAMGARRPFIEVLELLSGLPNVKHVHILAHSMGNLVVLDALGNYQTAERIKLGELIMAAPDVDRDLYTTIAASTRKLTKGMTLYASASDRALLASKLLAGHIPRAGDVPEGGPIVLDNIDSIDATALGEEIFGLNHGTFAKSLSILNDVLLLLKGLRLPRVVEIKSMPEGVDPPKYWRYITGRG